MKILHICLAAFYIDNYSYQENILPRMHKNMGYEVRILASTETFIDNVHLGYIKPSNYINEDGIEVHRIPYASFVPAKLIHKLRIYKKVYKELDDFKPDVIFIHDIQFLSIKSVRKYLKKHSEVRVFADGHADFSNSARSFFSKFFLHKLIYRKCAKMIEPFVEKFYGTLPARCDFFEKMYHINKRKISFLPMGLDDELATKVCTSSSINALKENLHLENKFIIVTGGKIDLVKKQTLSLIDAVNGLNDNNIRLIIFGSVDKTIMETFQKKLSNKTIYFGWANQEQSLQLFSLANVVVFPGRHSVYWEQAAGLGKPLIVKRWSGTEHVDLGGNVLFLENDTVEEITCKIKTVIYNSNVFHSMTRTAEQNKTFFYYSKIAERSIK